MESQIEEDVNDDEEIHGLSEARATYSDQELPHFVIWRSSDSLTREVVFRPRKKLDEPLTNCELVFESCDEEQNRGSGLRPVTRATGGSSISHFWLRKPSLDGH